MDDLEGRLRCWRCRETRLMQDPEGRAVACPVCADLRRRWFGRLPAALPAVSENGNGAGHGPS